MKHLGDITKINGFSAPPVDVITFGSPCQDLSVAGKRAGLAGERSGLFMEAVRIIKEMREATNGQYPKYAVWENVPGAFSSNKGEDFRAVLEELARIKKADVSIPGPDKSKWAKSGLITGNDWSIAWRTMDAQYWGVPQRRLRISLVLDLTGGRAGEILFEPESLRGHFAPSITPGQATAGTVEKGAGTADGVYAEVSNVCAFKLGNSEQARSIGYAEELAPTLNAECGGNKPACAYTLKIRSGCEGGGKGALVQTEKSATLSTLQDKTLFVAEPTKAYSFDSLASNSMKSSNPHSGCREVEIAKTLDTSPPDPAKNQGGIAIVEPTFCIQGNTIDRADTAGANGTGVKEDVCYTLNTIDRPAVAFALDCRNMTANEELSATLQAKSNGGQSLNYINPVCYAATTEPNMVICDDCSPAIRSRDYKDPNIVCYDARGNGDGKTSPTMTGDHNGRITDYTSVIIEKITRWIVRRLTPTECERLQGFPEIMEANIMEMTKDEYIAFNLAIGQIIADCENGKVYTTKGPGGNILKEPKELSGTIINGYRVVNIRNGNIKKQCRVHRIIWIAKNGIIQDGMVVDHINNDKLDNRINNLQLLTAKDNSTKASKDGLYRSGNKNPATILPEEKRIEVALLYQTGEFTMRQLAEKYGIGKSRVHQIVKTYGWTDLGEWVDSKGKTHKAADTPRYKALGNSIALPQWYYVLGGIADRLPDNATLGSLFDGIGGFPYVWAKLHNDDKSLCVWASEIEEFPIAVTKKQFPENNS